MALSINTNIASLQAQNNLSQVNEALQQNQERLSSGLRINSAADDAAGLAISDRMTSQIRGMNQAVRNSNDGISMAQTAEGGLKEITNILQRMRQLSVQASNHSNTESDRESIQTEVSQLQSELDRIAKNTEFNGQNLLNGSVSDAQFQVGANAGQTISVGIGSAKAGSVGHIAQDTGSVTTGTASDLQITLGDGNAVNIGSPSNYTGTDATFQDADSAYAKAESIKDAGISGLTASAETSVSTDLGTDTFQTSDAAGTYNLEINDTTIYDSTGATTSSGGGLKITEIRDQINAHSDETGVTASLDGQTLTLEASDGRDIEVTESLVSGSLSSGSLIQTGSDYTNTSGNNYLAQGSIELTASENITISGTNAAADYGFTDGQVISVDSKGVDSIDVSTFAGAQEGIQRIDAAISRVDNIRSNLGAVQNRFESTIANLENASQNLTEARSRIQDADIAKEAAEMTQNNVRRQAASAVLTQANQQPQLALQLLGG